MTPTCPKAPALAAQCPGQPPGIGPRWESGAPERNCKIGTWWVKRFSRITIRTNIREEQKDERLFWPANTFLSPFSLFCSHLKGEAIFSRSMDREMFLKSIFDNLVKSSIILSSFHLAAESCPTGTSSNGILSTIEAGGRCRTVGYLH